MGLNHPETNPLPPPSPVRGKTVFHQTGPQCPKGWDCCSKANDVAWIPASPLSLLGCSVSHCDDPRMCHKWDAHEAMI